MAIVIENLTKQFKDRTAVDHLSLTIHEGECFALLGENAAGKTTTIKMLSCLLTPTSGDAKMLGDSIIDDPEAVKQKLNLSPQETAVAPNLTVKENLEFIAKIYGSNAKEAAIQATELMERFGLGLPVIVMWMFSIMQNNMPFDLYSIEKLAPGVIIFSFSFITLFSGMLIGKDKSSSFLMRIFASPMKASDYMAGYTLPLIPLATLQIIVCFTAAFFLHLSLSVNLLIAFFVLLLIALLYIAFGLLLGTYFTDKQVGGIFAIFINFTAWFSGIWFELDMIGGAFKTISYALPFAHAVDAARFALSGEFGNLLVPLLWVIGYTVGVFVIAIVGFKKKMKD